MSEEVAVTDGARQRVVGGRYALEGLIATGGMGQVWRGRDTVLDRPVAVKLLRAEYGGDETVRARFRTEARLAGRLAHRNIAALYDYGEQSGDDGAVCAHLVMELVDGEPLSALLTREGALPADRVLDLLGQTAAGLAVAHAAGVVHRDVKPGNLLVGHDGVLRITDFGIAWSAASAPLTRTDQVVGTAHYLSPEQAGAGRAGPASDVYALGMVAWECLAGRRAFDGAHPVQIALRQLREEPPPLPGSVPPPVRELVARMVAKDPAGRPADGAALAEAVAAVRAGRALPPAPPPRTSPLPIPLSLPPAPPAARAPRRRGVRALGLAATLAAGAALGVGALQLAGPGSGTPPAAVADAVADAAAGAGAGAGPDAVPAGVDVRRGDASGRPADEVEDALVAAGLRVTRGTQESAAAVPGTVLGVTPVGRLAPGDLVTLTVAVAPPSPPPAVPSRAPSPAPVRAPGPASPPAAPAPTRDADPVTSESPSAPAPGAVQPGIPAPPPPDPEPDPEPDAGNGNAGGNGNGNGNGRGNGRGGRDG